MDNYPSQEYLNEVLFYEDGQLYWKVHKKKMRPGELAGRTKTNGYCEVRLDGKLYGTHRLIFKMANGYVPTIIDHIDGNPSNNKLENLREATHAQNMRNSQRPKSNTSGFKGVYLDRRNGHWIAQCFFEKQKFHLGSFEDIHDAARAVTKFREDKHQAFARHQ